MKGQTERGVERSRKIKGRWIDRVCSKSHRIKERKGRQKGC